MKKEINDYIQELEHFIRLADETGDCYDFQDLAFDIMDEIETLSNAKDFIEPILRLIERSPAIDFGGPGPFAFMEKFYTFGYEEKLVESLQRKPTNYTVFLLVRLCNDKNNPDREKYILLLKTVVNCDSIGDVWKKAAQEY